MQTNSASRRVMEKIGLKFVREFFDPEYPNSAVPEVEYAIKRDSWLKTQ
jgi:RimJ/RimL family protein N-acetyltransferase